MYICDMGASRTVTTKSNAGRPRVRYPFGSLKKIGDSFFVEDAGLARRGVYSSLRSYNKTVKKPISIRMKLDSGGMRVYKISSKNKK